MFKYEEKMLNLHFRGVHDDNGLKNKVEEFVF
jgi:hypothetical protein